MPTRATYHRLVGVQRQHGGGHAVRRRTDVLVVQPGRYNLRIRLTCPYAANARQQAPTTPSSDRNGGQQAGAVAPSGSGGGSSPIRYRSLQPLPHPCVTAPGVNTTRSRDSCTACGTRGLSRKPLSRHGTWHARRSCASAQLE